MTRRRRAIVYALVSVLAGGSLYDIVVDREHWPFSQYPMFSSVTHSWRFQSMWLYGVRADGGGGEFPLRDYAYLTPLDQCRNASALSWMRRLPDGQARLNDAVELAYRRYEALRTSGRHDGPRLQRARVYYVEYDLDRWARNAERPDTRILVAEYRP
jgi:hypothetical protein